MFLLLVLLAKVGIVAAWINLFCGKIASLAIIQQNLAAPDQQARTQEPNQPMGQAEQGFGGSLEPIGLNDPSQPPQKEQTRETEDDWAFCRAEIQAGERQKSSGHNQQVNRQHLKGTHGLYPMICLLCVSVFGAQECGFTGATNHMGKHYEAHDDGNDQDGDVHVISTACAR